MPDISAFWEADPFVSELTTTEDDFDFEEGSDLDAMGIDDPDYWNYQSHFFNWLNNIENMLGGESSIDLDQWMLYQLPSDLSSNYAGLQSTLWEQVFNPTADSGLAEVLSGVSGAFWLANPQELAYAFGQLGGGLTQGEAAAFMQEFADSFQWATWGDESNFTSYAGRLAALEEQYSLDEADMWDLYNTWQEGAADLLYSEANNMRENMETGQETIDDKKYQDLLKIVGERRAAERLKSQELTEERRKAGRTGFGAGKDFTLRLKEIEEELRGDTLSAFEVTESALQSEEELIGSTMDQGTTAIAQYQFDQQDKLDTLGTELETMRSQFLWDAEDIYSDWVTGLVDVSQNILIEIGGTGTFADWNPFGDGGAFSPGGSAGKVPTTSQEPPGLYGDPCMYVSCPPGTTCVNGSCQQVSSEQGQFNFYG